MTAYKLFIELSRRGGWADQPRKVRWLAARYYTGVDSLETLRSAAIPVEGTPRPLLTPAQVQRIIDLR